MYNAWSKIIADETPKFPQGVSEAGRNKIMARLETLTH